MKKYICDICGNEMPEERHMIIPIKSFDGDETFNIKCFDHCSYDQADICKRCEDEIKNAINESITAWIKSDENEKEETKNYIPCKWESVEETLVRGDGKIFKECRLSTRHLSESENSCFPCSGDGCCPNYSPVTDFFGGITPMTKKYYEEIIKKENPTLEDNLFMRQFEVAKKHEEDEEGKKCIRCDCLYYFNKPTSIDDDICRLCFNGSLYTSSETINEKYKKED